MDRAGLAVASTNGRNRRQPPRHRRCRPLYRRRTLHRPPCGAVPRGTALERIEDLTLPPGLGSIAVADAARDGSGTGDGLDAFVRPQHPRRLYAQPIAWPSSRAASGTIAAVELSRDGTGRQAQDCGPAPQSRPGPRVFYTSSPATTPMRASRTRIMGSQRAFRRRSRRSWMTWPRRSWRNA